MPAKISMQISNNNYQPRPRQPLAPVRMSLGSMPMIARLSNSVQCGSCGK